MHQLARLCNSDSLKKGVCSFRDSNRALLQAACGGGGVSGAQPCSRQPGRGEGGSEGCVCVSGGPCSCLSTTATAQFCQLFDLNSLRRTHLVHKQKTSGPFSWAILSSMGSCFSICYHQKHCLQSLSSGGHYLRTRGKTKG